MNTSSMQNCTNYYKTKCMIAKRANVDYCRNAINCATAALCLPSRAYMNYSWNNIANPELWDGQREQASKFALERGDNYSATQYNWTETGVRNGCQERKRVNLFAIFLHIITSDPRAKAWVQLLRPSLGNITTFCRPRQWVLRVI